MYDTERLLQVLVAVMVAMAAIMLGIGQQSSTLPILVILAAITSICFTDWLKWFRLPRTLANLAALFALLVSFGDYVDGGSQDQLLAIANLLILLEVVLFYQEKNERIYWQLTVLSLLQVVVAAAMNVGLEFGALLLVYMAIAFLTLAVFFVHREIGMAAEPTPRRRWSRATGEEAAELPPAWRRLVGGPAIVYPDRQRAALIRQLLGWRFLRHIAVMGLTTLAFTIVLFYTLPRRGTGRHLTSQGHQSVVGFSKEVKFNEMGEILQSPAPVMRVSFRQNGEPYEVRGEQYFRGAVMASYVSSRQQDREHSAWKPLKQPDQYYPASRNASPQRFWRRWRLEQADPNVPVVVQEYVMEPTADTVLFSTFPAQRVRETPADVRYFCLTGQLHRRAAADSLRVVQYRYVLGTTAYRNGFQAWVVPHEMTGDSPQQLNLVEHELEQLRQLPSDFERTFPQLKKYADQIMETELRLGSDTVQIARALHDHFRTGRYTYSLDFSRVDPLRDKSLDPIEDFVARHRTGHCEYFASALVLMLRSQGIPARLVLGYKGGEYNSVGRYYQVQSLHAHAWVEAHLTAEQAEPYLRPEFIAGPAGAWLRLDPTPASGQITTVRAEQGFLAKVDQALDYAQLLWYEYVMDLNPDEHEQLASRTSNVLGDLLEDSEWSDLSRALRRSRNRAALTSTSPWFSGRRVAQGILLVVLASGLSLAGLVLYRLLQRLFQRRGAPADFGSATSVEFYQRLEQLLGRAGLKRQSWQTQREFADSLVGHWSVGDHRLAWVDHVVTAFYDVRFGGASLDSGQLQTIEHALRELELAMVGTAGKEVAGRAR